MCPRSGVTQGPHANAMIASLRVRKAVMSVAAINDEGFFNNNLLLVETERAMMDAAYEVIIVADSSKFGHRSLALLCRLEDVDCIVTDAELPEEWREKITARGVELILAPVDEDDSAKSLPITPELGHESPLSTHEVESP